VNPGALVYCLLDAEGDYTPAGYRLITSARAGDYELKLWQGMAHVQGRVEKFVELSLNRVGLSFDPESQKQQFKGSIQALGQRRDLLYTVAQWLREYGTIFVGSHNPEKLAFYHRLLKRYLSRLRITDPYPAFDESEGVSDYFRIEPPQGANALESLIESLQDPLEGADPQKYVDGLPSMMERFKVECRAEFDKGVASGQINKDNKFEWADQIVHEIVDKLYKPSENELSGYGRVVSDIIPRLTQDLVLYAEQNT
jgi:hypothetical protein